MSRFFEERERAAETAFVHDEELRFLAKRRAIHALGTWAAGCMGLDPDATSTYEAQLVDAFIASTPDDRLIARVQTDLERAGKPSMAIHVGLELSRAEATAMGALRGGTVAAAAPMADPLETWDRHHASSSAWGSLRF